MRYLTTAEAGLRWGVSDRQAQRLAAEGRVPGAVKYGAAWMIPADAPKPGDPRRARAQADPPPLPRACPELIMTTLYHAPGSGERTAQALADPEARALFEAQLAYFRGETERARALADALLRSTNRPDVTVGCGFVLCLCAMYDGDAARWARARLAIARAPQDAALREFQLANVDSGLYNKDSFPDWFRQGRFDPLPLDCYPLARLLYLKWLMLSRGDPSVSTLCGPLISQSRAEGALLSEVYCRLLAAIGYHDRGEKALAAEHIDAALALALPDRLYAPLAEYRNELGLLLDERLSAVDRAAAAAVRTLNGRLMAGWGKLYAEVRGRTFATSLTLREHHAAKLAAKGLSNAEIASRMGLSVNTVKRYLSEAVAKTGARDRTELALYIALEGPTVP